MNNVFNYHFEKRKPGQETYTKDFKCECFSFKKKPMSHKLLVKLYLFIYKVNPILYSKFASYIINEYSALFNDLNLWRNGQKDKELSFYAGRRFKSKLLNYLHSHLL